MRSLNTIDLFLLYLIRERFSVTFTPQSTILQSWSICWAENRALFMFFVFFSDHKGFWTSRNHLLITFSKPPCCLNVTSLVLVFSIRRPAGNSLRFRLRVLYVAPGLLAVLYSHWLKFSLGPTDEFLSLSEVSKKNCQPIQMSILCLTIFELPPVNGYINILNLSTGHPNNSSQQHPNPSPKAK